MTELVLREQSTGRWPKHNMKGQNVHLLATYLVWDRRGALWLLFNFVFRLCLQLRRKLLSLPQEYSASKQSVWHSRFDSGMEKNPSDFSTSVTSSALIRQLFWGGKEKKKLISFAYSKQFSLEVAPPQHLCGRSRRIDYANSALSLQMTSSLNPTARSIRVTDRISPKRPLNQSIWPE